MKFNKTELEIIKILAEGEKDIEKIARAINRTKNHTYILLRKLNQEHIIKNREIEKIPHLKKLSRLLIFHPQLIDIFSDNGLEILQLLPCDIQSIKKKLKIKKSIIYSKIKKAKNINLIKKEKQYKINNVIWKEVSELINSIKDYEKNIDYRIPIDSKIIEKNKDEILFTSLKKIDASLTGFSAYKDYGINIVSEEKDYFLPKKKLSMNKVFSDSLKIAGGDYRLNTYTILFYLKNKHNLFRVDKKFLEVVKKIIKGEKIPNFPDKKELKEKAEIYDIKIWWYKIFIWRDK